LDEIWMDGWMVDWINGEAIKMDGNNEINL
jgi:hypothetical protein